MGIMYNSTVNVMGWQQSLAVGGFYWFSFGLLPTILTDIILLPDFMHGVIGMESRPLICVIRAAYNLPLAVGRYMLLWTD